MKIGDLTVDEPIIRQVRYRVNEILNDDATLSKLENANMKTYFYMRYAKTFDWGKIG